MPSADRGMRACCGTRCAGVSLNDLVRAFQLGLPGAVSRACTPHPCAQFTIAVPQEFFPLSPKTTRDAPRLRSRRPLTPASPAPMIARSPAMTPTSLAEATAVMRFGMSRRESSSRCCCGHLLVLHPRNRRSLHHRHLAPLVPSRWAQKLCPKAVLTSPSKRACFGLFDPSGRLWAQKLGTEWAQTAFGRPNARVQWHGNGCILGCSRSPQSEHPCGLQRHRAYRDAGGG